MPTWTGLRFPPLPDPSTGALSTVSDHEAVAQSLRVLMHTEPGERVGRPGYGAGLRRFLFAPDNVGTRALIQQTVLEAVRRDEPRARPQDVRVLSDGQPGRLLVELVYTVAGDPTPRSVLSQLLLDDSRS